MKPFFAAIAFLLLYSCSYAQQVEDWIYFKDSTVAKGTVLRMDNEKISVKNPDNSVQVFSTSDVKRIARSKSESIPPPAYNQTAIVLGYNFVISKNFAVQPILRQSFIKLEKEKSQGHNRFTCGIDIAAYFF